MYLDMVWNSFKDMIEDDGSFAVAQAYQLMSLAYLYSQHVYLGRKFFQKAVALFRTHWIDFLASPLPDLTESLQEHIAFLGEAIYTEIDCTFMFGLVQELTLDLEYGFRHELLAAYPQVFERCNTMMLARDARTLLGSPIVSGNHVTRLLSCQTQLSFLQSHLPNLNSLLGQYGPISGGRETCASVRLCIIITLVTQAELYDDMCHNSLLSASEGVQYRSRYRECLSEAVAITAELSPDDYYYLDPYLGVCWNRAISLLTKEQPSGFQPSLGSHMTMVSSIQRASFTAETLGAYLSVLRLARRSVSMSVCLVPGGPKTLCGQLTEYRRPGSLNSLGRFTEV
ncbi:hypothetical protein BDM02DRAFT_1491381 [Thelephora ganbajun]|uniref:Uncharacterized protein n=1 Tax=Thelephora ganbajun TaxID=370292 RepID=A0ACB6ZLA7_THEGA|nr:hypothetical protein BDM02DRAFT_1491381 [Thelephora ganbajun]